MRYIIVAIALVYNLPLIILYFIARYFKKWIIDGFGQEIGLDVLYHITLDRRWEGKDEDWVRRWVYISNNITPKTKLGKYIRWRFTGYVTSYLIRKSPHNQKITSKTKLWHIFDKYFLLRAATKE